MPIDRRMDKDVVHIYNGILLIKGNETGSFVEMWMEIETVIQSEGRPEALQGHTAREALYPWVRYKLIQMCCQS